MANDLSLLPDVQGGLHASDHASEAALNKPFWVQVTGTSGNYYTFKAAYPGYLKVFTLLAGGAFGLLFAPNNSKLALNQNVLVQRSYLDPAISQWIFAAISTGSGNSTFLATTTSAVSARVGNQFGVGTASLDSIPNGLLTDTGADVEVWNKFLPGHAIPAGVNVTLALDQATGKYWIVEPDRMFASDCIAGFLYKTASVDGGKTFLPFSQIGCITCAPCPSGSGSGSGPVSAVCLTLGSGPCAGSYPTLLVGTNTWEAFGIGGCNVVASCSMSAPSTGCPCLATTYSQYHVSFPGLTSSLCDCSTLASGITFNTSVGVDSCGGSVILQTACPGPVTQLVISFLIQCTPAGQAISLDVRHVNSGGGLNYDVIYAPDAASLPWNGASPLVLKFVTISNPSGLPAICTPASWPASVTITPAGSIIGGSTCVCTLDVNGTIYTADGTTCNPFSATFLGVDLSVCGCGSTSVTLGGCSGSSSGSGSGPSCNVTRTSLGTVSGTNAGSSKDFKILGVTVNAGTKLIVQAGYAITGGGVPGISSVKFNGVSLALDVSSASETSGSITLTTRIYSITVAATTTADIVIHSAVPVAETALVLASAEFASNLGTNSFDKSASAIGLLGTPDTGFTPTTSAACEYAEGCFMMEAPGGTGTPGNGFTTGGQDVTGTVSGVSFTLTEMYRFLTSQTAVDAIDNGITPVAWAGAVATYD